MTYKLQVSYLTAVEYLEAEQKSESRHEYLGGQVFAMSGGSREHNQIAGNIYSSLRSHLRGSGCSTFIADMKVKIQTANLGADIFYYPDVAVTCNPEDRERFFLTSPCLIVEVLSSSTEVVDRREKRLNYQTIYSLQEYALVSQSEMRVEVYRREEAAIWTIETLSSGVIQLDSVGLNLNIAEVYEDVFA